MIDASYLDGIIQAANGMAIAPLFGSPFAVRRLSPYANGTILAQPPILTAAFQLERSTKRDLVETQLFDTVWMIATGDGRQMLLGDILTGTGADTSTYCYAQHRLTDPVIFVQCDAFATLKRPVEVADRSTALPQSGFVAVTGDDEVDEATADVLTLTAGRYAFTPAASNPIAAAVPVGLQPTARAMGMHGENLPTSEPVGRFFAYIPPLGLELLDNDEIEVGADTYTIVSSYRLDTAQVVGTAAILAKSGA